MTAWIFILLSAGGAVLIAHLLKYTEHRKLSTLRVLTVNYLTAASLAFATHGYGVGAWLLVRGDTPPPRAAPRPGGAPRRRPVRWRKAPSRKALQLPALPHLTSRHMAGHFRTARRRSGGRCVSPSGRRSPSRWRSRWRS
jgi:hypothetical protein